MKKLAIAGLSIGVLGVGLYFGANLYGTKVAEAKVNKLIDGMEDENLAVEYKDISFNPLGQDVHLEDITIKATDDPTEITIEKVIIREIDEKSDMPTVMDASVKGLAVDLNKPEQLEMARFLKEAGYDTELTFDIDTKYQYDPTTREMNVETLKVSANQVGDLNVKMKLGNVDLDTIESPKATPTSNMDTLFHGFEITYRDDSFADKLLESIAAEQGISVGELKGQMTTQLTQASQFFISTDNELANQAVSEAIAFIEDPKGFSISVQPDAPLQVDNLMSENPDNWADMLNIEIKAF